MTEKVIVWQSTGMSDKLGTARRCSMTDALTEKVAKEIHDKDLGGWWEELDEVERDKYRDQAKAAIVAVLKEIRWNTKPLRYAWLDHLIARYEGGQK